MNSTGNHSQSPRKKLIIILAAIPPIILIFFLLKYRIEAPVADQWELVSLLDKAYNDTLTVKDLWVLHNEHRPFFSRLILIVLAQLSHWTTLYELLTNFVIASVTFLGIIFLLKKAEIEFSASLLGLIPAISFIIFGLHQSESWFNGYNIQIFLNIAAVTWALIFLGTHQLNWKRTILAAFLGLIATFTFANGLLLWPLGVWILYIRIRHFGKGWNLLAFWLLISTVSIALYFTGYESPSHHPSIWSFLQRPMQAFNYVLAYTGAPLFAFTKKTETVANWLSQQGLSLPEFLFWFPRNASSFAGAIGIGIFLYFLHQSKSIRKNSSLISLFALSTYVLLTASVSALGRSAMGIESALNLRYVTISSLFWISLLVLLKLSNVTLKSKRWTRFCSGTIMFLIFINSIYGALYAVKLHGYLTPARSELYRMQDEQLLERLFPDTDFIRQSIPILKKHRLSVFKNQATNRE